MVRGSGGERVCDEVFFKDVFMNGKMENIIRKKNCLERNIERTIFYCVMLLVYGWVWGYTIRLEFV